MSDDYQPYALDWTELRDRPKRLWSFGNIPVPGLSLPGIYGGAVALMLWAVGAFVVTRVVALPGVVLVLGGVIAAAAAYAAMGLRFPDGMKAEEWFVVWLDWTFRQPRAIHGLDKDREPTHIRWQVIVWEPTATSWWDEHATAVAARERNA